MKKIVILTGAYGHHQDGKKIVKPVYRGQTVFVPDDEAERLVLRGAAEVVGDDCEKVVSMEVATPADSLDVCAECVNTLEEETSAGSEETAHLAREQIRELSNAKLKELAEEMGIDCARLRTKAQLIAAISDVPLEDAIADSNTDEQPPSIDAEEPVT